MSFQTLYTEKLQRFRAAISALPLSLPSGSTLYNFRGWKPDPDRLETHGAECSVLNADLEVVFGLRAISGLTIQERRAGIESLADVFMHYLMGNYREQAVVAKWVDDLTEAAEALSNTVAVQSKRVSHPSAAKKRSNEYVEEVAQATAGRKKARSVAAAKADWAAKAAAKTAQNGNWKGGFEDLMDVEPDSVLYTTGRPSIPIVNELVIKCVARSTGDTRWRCAVTGCKESWASRQARRVLSHATEECCFIGGDLQERAAVVASSLSLGDKVEELNGTKEPLPAQTSSQPSVRAIVSAEGWKATQTRFDFNLVNFISAAQLPPSAFNIPEFHTLVSEANINLAPKHSTYIASSQIPMESARIRRLDIKELKGSSNLTISFDGGTSMRPQSFTTIHITDPDTREAYLIEGIEASGVSHTGKYYFGKLGKVIEEVGPLLFSAISCDSTGSTRVGRELVHTTYPTIIILPDACHSIHNTVKDVFQQEYFIECKSRMQKLIRFFSKSTFAAAHLKSAQEQRGITCGLDKPGKTRFGGWYYAAVSILRCLPAIEQLVKDNVIEVKPDHKLHFIKNVVAYERFKTEVYQLVKITEPFARAIKCLESSFSNPSNVFLFYLAIMASLRQLFDNNSSELSLPDEVISYTQKAASARYYDMVLATGNEWILSGYINSDILRRNNTNPLSTSIIMRPKSIGDTFLDDEDLRQMIPAFAKIGLYLKTILCRELSAGTIPAAKEYPSDEAGVVSIITAFKSQFTAYARGRYPFTVPSPLPPSFDPLAYWKKLALNRDASFLAPLAVKLFSLVPNSMAEERTVSCFTKLNSKGRASQMVSTLVQMTRIRQHLLRKRNGPKVRVKPVLKFRDLSTTLLRQRDPIGVPREEENAPIEVLVDGWQAEDKEVPGQTSHASEDSDAGTDLDDEDDNHEAVADEARGFEVIDAYGIDLGNPLLCDMLSDKPIEPKASAGSAQTVGKSSSGGSNIPRTAKKDTSGVDLDEY